MGIAARLLAAVPAVALLAWAGMTAVDIARAQGHVLAASTEMSAWAAVGNRPQLETWEVVRGHLQAAERIVPRDPTTHELLGLLAKARSDGGPYQSEAVSHLHRALELRPASPYTWANLVEAKYNQGEPGRNLQVAILRAAELGPAEPGVQRTIANYGLAVWDEVDAPTQGAIDRMVAAGFRRNPLEMLLISERRGRLDTVCRHLDGYSRTPDPRLTLRCKGREATP